MERADREGGCKGGRIPKSINIRGKYLVALLHAYPRTRDNARQTDERIVAAYVCYRCTGTESVVGKPVGVILAAKLQCPATHNAATVLATVIILVLTTRLAFPTPEL